MISAHLDSSETGELWGKRRDKRNSKFSQPGAGSVILERKQQTLPAPRGPCLAFCCPKGHWIWQPSQRANSCWLPQWEVQGQENSSMIPALNACSIATVCIYALRDMWREGLFLLLLKYCTTGRCWMPWSSFCSVLLTGKPKDAACRHSREPAAALPPQSYPFAIASFEWLWVQARAAATCFLV